MGRCSSKLLVWGWGWCSGPHGPVLKVAHLGLGLGLGALGPMGRCSKLLIWGWGWGWGWVLWAPWAGAQSCWFGAGAGAGAGCSGPHGPVVLLRVPQPAQPSKEACGGCQEQLTAPAENSSNH